MVRFYSGPIETLLMCPILMLLLSIVKGQGTTWPNGHYSKTVFTFLLLKSVYDLKPAKYKSTIFIFSIDLLICFLSRKSDFRNANVSLSVRLFVRHRNLSSTQSCSYWPSRLLTTEPIRQSSYSPSAYLPLTQSTIESINSLTPLRLSE